MWIFGASAARVSAFYLVYHQFKNANAADDEKPPRAAQGLSHFT
jgi:hypothetical protein